MEERGRYAKLIHNLRGLQFKVSLSLLGCKRLGASPHNFWPEVLSFRFQRNFILSLGSWAHVRCSGGGSPEGEPCWEKWRRWYNQSSHHTSLITHGSWVDTDLSLFLTLVLAPGDEKREGKESETESEFVDIKGIYCSFPRLHTVEYLLGIYRLGQRSAGMLSFVGSWNCVVYCSVSLGVQLPEF